MIWQDKTAPAHKMILSVANESEQRPMPRGREDITKLILRAAEQARLETSAEPEKDLTKHVRWPIDCQVGPGLEGAIACESRVGYVNGTRGWLIYRGYNIFDLAAHSSFEEVTYLLLHGRLPTSKQLERFKSQLISYRPVPDTLRHLMGFPVEHMHPMAALRLGTSLLRMQQTYADAESARPDAATAISADEDSIPMELKPWGDPHAIYEFKGRGVRGAPSAAPTTSPGSRPLVDAAGVASAYRLIAGVPTLAAAVARVRRGKMPLEPDPALSHAGNFLYMVTGRRPSKVEERVMDVSLILHADHGMNASTFACLVVASTLSDVYWSIGSGIAALSGPLHGGANEEVLHMLRTIGGPKHVRRWLAHALARKQKIMGFGHRVYKAPDPRARILGPLAKALARRARDEDVQALIATADELERQAVAALKDKKVFPNVDFYSGLVYAALGIPPEHFTPIFAVARVSGWCARVLEYLQNNRIFRPRATYVGPINKEYTPVERRGRRKK